MTSNKRNYLNTLSLGKDEFTLYLVSKKKSPITQRNQDSKQGKNRIAAT